MVLSQLQVGIKPEGLNMLLMMNYLLFHLDIFFQLELTLTVQSMNDDYYKYSVIFAAQKRNN